MYAVVERRKSKVTEQVTYRVPVVLGKREGGPRTIPVVELVRLYLRDDAPGQIGLRQTCVLCRPCFTMATRA